MDRDTRPESPMETLVMTEVGDLRRENPHRNHPVRSRQVTATLRVLEERLAHIERRIAELETR